MKAKKICENQQAGQLLTAMQVNLNNMYTRYLVNIFATPNNLNLKMQKRSHHIIAFHSSGNVFKVTLKWWCLSKTWCVSPHSMNFYRRRTCSDFRSVTKMFRSSIGAKLIAYIYERGNSMIKVGNHCSKP